MSDPTLWHQDLPFLPHDRDGRPNIWIALVDVPPERGSLRFLSGSHRAGLVGRFADKTKRDALEELPHLAEKFALANTTDEVRWAYIHTFVGADVRYSGLPNRVADAADGLELDELFDHPSFPLVEELAPSWQ